MKNDNEKKEFLLRQIAKTNKKNWENYVVTRVIHQLDDLSVKIVTQQHVSLPDDKRALTDLFFPQIGVHVEVDEPPHETDENAKKDAIREADIVDATGHTVHRVRVKDKSLVQINKQVAGIIEDVQGKIQVQRVDGTFREWDPGAESDPKTYVARGYLDIHDDVAFRTIADACNCFGHSFKGMQKAFVRHGRLPNLHLWFPKLYKNDDWSNSISPDERVIKEQKKKGNESFIEKYLAEEDKHRRIVFARVKGPLGDVMYRFKGLFDVDVEESRRSRAMTHRRVETRVDTFEYVEKAI